MKISNGGMDLKQIENKYIIKKLKSPQFNPTLISLQKLPWTVVFWTIFCICKWNDQMSRSNSLNIPTTQLLHLIFQLEL